MSLFSCQFKALCAPRNLIACSSRSMAWIDKSSNRKGSSEERQRRMKGQDESLKWAMPLLEMAEQQQEVTKRPPHMLHVVRRIKTLSGRPWWEKDICKEFELDGKMHDPVILKNIPEVNKRLREIKHLIQIQALSFPHGLPEHESDFQHTLLKSNGELVVKKRLDTYEPDPDQANDNQKWTLQLDTIKKELKRQKQDFKIRAEYHKTAYEYKRNEDGKEYRYNFNKEQQK